MMNNEYAMNWRYMNYIWRSFEFLKLQYIYSTYLKEPEHNFYHEMTMNSCYCTFKTSLQPDCHLFGNVYDTPTGSLSYAPPTFTYHCMFSIHALIY